MFTNIITETEGKLLLDTFSFVLIKEHGSTFIFVRKWLHSCLLSSLHLLGRAAIGRGVCLRHIGSSILSFSDWIKLSGRVGGVLWLWLNWSFATLLSNSLLLYGIIFVLFTLGGSTLGLFAFLGTLGSLLCLFLWYNFDKFQRFWAGHNSRVWQQSLEILLEIVDLPSILWKENWQIQVPDLRLSLEFELVVFGDWILIFNHTLACNNEYFVQFKWVVELHFELSEGWHDEFLAILPHSWQIFLNLNGSQLTLVIDYLLDGEIVVRHLNFNNLFPLLLGWILDDN